MVLSYNKYQSSLFQTSLPLLNKDIWLSSVPLHKLFTYHYFVSVTYSNLYCSTTISRWQDVNSIYKKVTAWKCNIQGLVVNYIKMLSLFFFLFLIYFY